MEKITFKELGEIMWDYNQDHKNGEDSNSTITGVIVYKESNWDKPYTETERSYRVSNHNRRFQANKIANSLYGYCLDGKDMGVRLDWYNWDVEYCYMDEGAVEL